MALIDAGGELECYGLADLKHQHPAADQLSFLEGLLPLEEAVFLLQSVGMPSGRVADVHFFAQDDSTWVVLLDVTEEHDNARKMQQKAYDMTLLSQREARLIAKLEAAHADLTLAHNELAQSRDEILRIHDRLQHELRDAERYVLAILPAPVEEPFAVDWLFVPSTELGGDSFGYHWIDTEHFALYLLDVCGHGVGSALLSLTVANTIRSGALLNTDFRMPEAVLRVVEPIVSDGASQRSLFHDLVRRLPPPLRDAALCECRPPIANSGKRRWRRARRSENVIGSGFSRRVVNASRRLHGRRVRPRRPRALVPLQRRRFRNHAAGRDRPGIRSFRRAAHTPSSTRRIRIGRTLSVSRKKSAARKTWTMIFQS